MKQLTVKQIGYEIRGELLVEFWEGGEGWIEMKPFILTELTDENILNGLNDDGFGVRSYIEASIDIYELYQRGVTEFVESKYVDAIKGTIGI